MEYEEGEARLRWDEWIIRWQNDVNGKLATLIWGAYWTHDLPFPMQHVRLVDQLDHQARCLWVFATLFQLLPKRRQQNKSPIRQPSVL